MTTSTPPGHTLPKGPNNTPLLASQLIIELARYIAENGDNPVCQYGDDGLPAPVRYTEAQLSNEDAPFVFLY